MICIYDLYDLHAIFTAVRSSPLSETNADVISKVIKVLKDRHINNETNQFRTALRTIGLLDTQGLWQIVWDTIAKALNNIRKKGIQPY